MSEAAGQRLAGAGLTGRVEEGRQEAAAVVAVPAKVVVVDGDGSGQCNHPLVQLQWAQGETRATCARGWQGSRARACGRAGPLVCTPLSTPPGAAAAPPADCRWMWGSQRRPCVHAPAPSRWTAAAAAAAPACPGARQPQWWPPAAPPQAGCCQSGRHSAQRLPVAQSGVKWVVVVACTCELVYLCTCMCVLKGGRPGPAALPPAAALPALPVNSSRPKPLKLRSISANVLPAASLSSKSLGVDGQGGGLRRVQACVGYDAYAALFWPR